MLMLFSAPENVQRKLVYENSHARQKHRRLPFGHETYRQKILERFCTIRLKVQSCIQPLLTQRLTTRGEQTMKNSRSTETSNLVRGVGGDSSPLDAVLRPLGENQKWKTLARQNFPTSFEVTGGIHPLLTQSSDHLGRTKNEKLSHDRISEPRLRWHGD